MLPIWQKPKDTFMAPTYTIGGSDFSRTRQGGINLIRRLVSVVFVLLGENFNKNRGNSIFRFVFTDFFIDLYDKNTFKIKVLSTPKVLSRP